MDIKWKGNVLLGEDGKIIATFDPSISKAEIKQIGAKLLHGEKMLNIYNKFRNNFHIVSVVEMLEIMEDINAKYRTEIDEAQSDYFKLHNRK